MCVIRERCREMLRVQFKRAIRKKHRGLLYSGVCLQREDVRHHTAYHIAKEI
jgi:hypothetical protein